jgi:hypothetical protein
VLVIPQDGTLALAEFLRRGIALRPFAALYINNYNPVQTTTLADLTEASYVGYARQLLATWTPAVADGTNGAVISAPASFWHGTGPPPPQRVYGWFALQLDWTATPRLLWAERGSPSVVLGPGSGLLILNPVFDFRSVFG